MFLSLRNWPSVDAAVRVIIANKIEQIGKSWKWSFLTFYCLIWLLLTEKFVMMISGASQTHIHGLSKVEYYVFLWTFLIIWLTKGYRPKLLPWSPEEINPMMYFSSDEVTDELLDWKNPSGSFLRNVSSKETIITVHGWTDYYNPKVCDTCDGPGRTWMGKAKKMVRSGHPLQKYSFKG